MRIEQSSWSHNIHIIYNRKKQNKIKRKQICIMHINRFLFIYFFALCCWLSLHQFYIVRLVYSSFAAPIQTRYDLYHLDIKCHSTIHYTFSSGRVCVKQLFKHNFYKTHTQQKWSVAGEKITTTATANNNNPLYNIFFFYLKIKYACFRIELIWIKCFLVNIICVMFMFFNKKKR